MSVSTQNGEAAPLIESPPDYVLPVDTNRVGSSVNRKRIGADKSPGPTDRRDC